MNAMAAAFDVDSLVSAPSMPVLRVTHDSLDLIGGKLFGLGGKPEVLLSLPLSYDAVFTTSRAPQGIYMLHAWHLRQTINGTSYDLDLIPSHAVFGLIPWNYSLGEMRTAAATMQQIVRRPAGTAR